MDPLAHTLVGAALAETGLRRLAPRATLVLIVGANLPDIDALSTFLGPDTSLLLRRGWTHGPLAMLLLPPLLVALLLWRDRQRWREDPARAGPPHAARLLGLAWSATLSHPALDWLNTYGVRLLMPFDGRWFYGDALVVVDPWMWLLAGAAVVLARSQSGRALAGWALVATLTTLLVFSGPTPPAVRVAWLVGVAAVALARAARPGPPAVARVARGALIALAVYIAGMISASRAAADAAEAWLARDGVSLEHSVVIPLPGRPFLREVVGVASGAYHFVHVDAASGEVTRTSPPRPRRPPDALVQTALDQPAVRGLRGWLRLPDWEVQPVAGGGHRVVIRDLRYARDTYRGFGVALVSLGREGRPSPAEPDR